MCLIPNQQGLPIAEVRDTDRTYTTVPLCIQTVQHLSKK